MNRAFATGAVSSRRQEDRRRSVANEYDSVSAEIVEAVHRRPIGTLTCSSSSSASTVVDTPGGAGNHGLQHVKDNRLKIHSLKFAKDLQAFKPAVPYADPRSKCFLTSPPPLKGAFFFARFHQKPGVKFAETVRRV